MIKYEKEDYFSNVSLISLDCFIYVILLTSFVNIVNGGLLFVLRMRITLYLHRCKCRENLLMQIIRSKWNEFVITT